MKTIYRACYSLVLSFALLLIFTASTFAAAPRHINIAGLVVDAQSLSPIATANIYDANNTLLGTTNDKGYFKILFTYDKSGEIYFKLRITKDGYKTYTQTEHWGNLPDGESTVMYFGIKAKGEATEAFSSFGASSGNSGNLSYEYVFAGFNKVKQQQSFIAKLAAAKTGNEDVFLDVDGTPYLVNNTGWIKLNSADDMVSIDKKQTLAANRLNSVIKRKSVKWMTPVEGKSVKFELHTK